MDDISLLHYYCARMRRLIYRRFTMTVPECDGWGIRLLASLQLWMHGMFLEWELQAHQDGKFLRDGTKKAD
jgi:hypothetical protein